MRMGSTAQSSSILGECLSLIAQSNSIFAGCLSFVAKSNSISAGCLSVIANSSSIGIGCLCLVANSDSIGRIYSLFIGCGIFTGFSIGNVCLCLVANSNSIFRSCFSLIANGNAVCFATLANRRILANRNQRVIRCQVFRHGRRHACAGHHSCRNQHCQQLFGRAAFATHVFGDFGHYNVSVARLTPNYLKYFVHDSSSLKASSNLSPRGPPRKNQQPFAHIQAKPP